MLWTLCGRRVPAPLDPRKKTACLRLTAKRDIAKNENRGNEAVEYLKTKDMTLLKAANSAPFACKLIAIEPRKEEKIRRFAKTN